MQQVLIVCKRLLPTASPIVLLLALPSGGFRSCFEMVAEVYYMDFSRQFHLWKRERSRSYVTDEKGENGRKGRVNNKSNEFKTASNNPLFTSSRDIERPARHRHAETELDSAAGERGCQVRWSEESLSNREK